MGAAQPNPALTIFQQGAGRVDLDRATLQDVVSETGSLHFGAAPFPHDDDEPISRAVRYHNRGSAPVHLSLTGSLSPLSGGAAPAGMISISPATLLVPAGSAAEAQVTIDTSVEALNGVYSGVLLASGDGARVVTTVAVERESPMVQLELQLRGVDGGAGQGFDDILREPLGV